MSAESAEDEAEFVVGIAVPVETAEHEEPAAGRDLVAHPRQVVGHRGEREFFPRHRRVISVAAAQAAHRGVDLLECRRRQPDDPVVGPHEVLAKPHRPSTRTIRRLERHEHLLPSCSCSSCCIVFTPVADRRAQVYCASTPRSLTMRWAIARSSARNVRKSFSFWPAGTKVLSPKPGVATIFPVTSAIFSTISRGVPAGAKSPNQVGGYFSPGRSSLRVGISGNSAIRSMLLTASPVTRPLSRYDTIFAAPRPPIGVVLASMALASSVPLRNGTLTASIPFSFFSFSMKYSIGYENVP